MSKAENIAAINAKLATADEETVKAVVEFVEAVTGGTSVRPLSAREQSLLEQSREDFAAGRTYTMEESRARTDALIARYRAASKPTTS